MNPFFRKIAFCVANVLGALVALYIAYSLDLGRPFWAVFSIFISAQPISGQVRARGVYRVSGTLVGAAFSILVVPTLVHAPVLLSLVIASWIGFCLFFSLRERTPLAAAFRLAGTTAIIAGLSIVNTPELVFDTALARVEEVSLGAICATVAHSVIFPQNLAAVLNLRIARSFSACTNWIARALVRPADPADNKDYLSLSRLVTDLHLTYSEIRYETSDVPRVAPVMRTLQSRLSVLLPCVTGIQRAVATMPDGEFRSSPIFALLRQTSQWIAGLSVGHPGDSTELTPALNKANAAAEEATTWTSLTLKSIVDDVAHLVDALVDIQWLAAALAEPGTALPPRLSAEVDTSKPWRLPTDGGLAFLSSAAATGAVLIACALWMWGAWPQGAIGAQFAAIGCTLFATMDSPAKILGLIVTAVLLTLPLGAFYEYVILPQADGFASLAVAITPILFGFSWLISYPKLAGVGTVMALTFSGSLALQTSYQPDFASFINTNLAEIAGILLAIAVNMVFRTISPIWNAERISRAGWRATSSLARGHHFDRNAWVAQMFDRLGEVNSRLDKPVGPVNPNIDGLRDIRIGMSVATLRRAMPRLTEAARQHLSAVLNSIATIFDGWAGTSPCAQTGIVEESLEAGRLSLVKAPETAEQHEALLALARLHADLVRQAAGHASIGSDQ